MTCSSFVNDPFSVLVLITTCGGNHDDLGSGTAGKVDKCFHDSCAGKVASADNHQGSNGRSVLGRIVLLGTENSSGEGGESKGSAIVHEASY